MRYVVDIDETICLPGKTEEERYTGATPINNRIEFVNKLYEEGHHVTYFTARGMGRFKQDREKATDLFYEFTQNQLDGWGCKYHELFLGKPSADYYIDDKGINAHEFFGTD